MVLLCSGDDASAGNGKTIGDLLKSVMVFSSTTG